MIRYGLTLLIEITCLIVAWRYVRNDKERHWALQPWYLLVVVITEGVGGYIGTVQGENNLWLYNAFLLVEGTFISYFIYRICKPYGVRAIHWQVWMALFLGCFTTERLVIDDLNVYSYWTIMMICISFMMGGIYYAYLLFRAAPVPFPLARYGPSLWMSAICSFYFGTFVATLLAEPLITSPVELAGIPLYSTIFLVLNLLLYGIWIVSFMYRYRNLY